MDTAHAPVVDEFIGFIFLKQDDTKTKEMFRFYKKVISTKFNDN